MYHYLLITTKLAILPLVRGSPLVAFRSLQTARGCFVLHLCVDLCSACYVPAWRLQAFLPSLRVR